MGCLKPKPRKKYTSPVMYNKMNSTEHQDYHKSFLKDLQKEFDL